MYIISLICAILSGTASAWADGLPCRQVDVTAPDDVTAIMADVKKVVAVVVFEDVADRPGPLAGNDMSSETAIPGVASKASHLTAHELKGLGGTLLAVQYQRPGSPLMSLSGGKLGKYYYVGKMKIGDLAYGDGYVWADPKAMALVGSQDIRVFRLRVSSDVELSHYLGGSFRVFASDSEGLYHYSGGPRAGLGIERKKKNSTDSTPAINLKAAMGPGIGESHGVRDRGAVVDSRLEVQF